MARRKVKDLPLGKLSQLISAGAVQAWFRDGLTFFIVAESIGTDNLIAVWSTCCGSQREFTVPVGDVFEVDIS